MKTQVIAKGKGAWPSLCEEDSPKSKVRLCLSERASVFEKENPMSRCLHFGIGLLIMLMTSNHSIKIRNK